MSRLLRVRRTGHATASLLTTLRCRAAGVSESLSFQSSTESGLGKSKTKTREGKAIRARFPPAALGGGCKSGPGAAANASYAAGVMF
jgi:hypothetical protein